MAFDDIYVEYHSNGDKDKNVSIEEYINMIKPYLSDIINDHKDEWKIQLSVRINFVPSVDSKDSEDSNKIRKNIFACLFSVHNTISLSNVLCIQIVIILLLPLAMKQMKSLKNFLNLF